MKSNKTNNNSSLVLVPFLVLLIAYLLICANFHIPNKGQHTGYVTSVEQSGLIWKTWTVYIKTDPQSSQEDTYCVEDSNLVTQLQTASQNRNLVTVDYSVPFMVWKWNCGHEQSIVQTISSNGSNENHVNEPIVSNQADADCGVKASNYYKSGNYLTYNVASNSSYTNHYNNTYKKCLIEITSTVSKYSYASIMLYDVDTGTLWGYATAPFNSNTGEMATNATQCSLYRIPPYINEAVNCDSINQFSVDIKPLMTN